MGGDNKLQVGKTGSEPNSDLPFQPPQIHLSSRVD
jgi:hypothetical protein